MIGPIQVLQIQGKGRGLAAARDVEPGELLMLVPPLAFLASDKRQRPSPQQLVDHLLRTQAAHSPWLDVLYDGTPKSTRPVPDLVAGYTAPAAASSSRAEAAPATQAASQAGADSRARRTPPRSAGGGSQAPPGSPGAAGSGARRVPPAPAGLSTKLDRRQREARQAAAKRAAKVVAHNAFGEDHADLAAAALAGQPPVGHIGLWPEFALLNHSCAPNAVNWVQGGHMLVRAAARIPAGSELLISYLGRPQLAPLPARQAGLKDNYGFNCSCERCSGEMASWQRVGSVVEALDLQVSSELQPALKRALEAQDAEAVQEVRQEAQALLLELYATFRRRMVPPAQRLWHCASCYSALELVADADRALAVWAAADDACAGSCSGDGRARQHWEDACESLRACLRTAQAVTPGSDLHVIVAAQLLHASRCARDAEDTSAVTAAREAHTLRYGQLGEAVQERFSELNRILYD